MQGVARCMAQAGSLPDIAEQTARLSEMELWASVPTLNLLTRNECLTEMTCTPYFFLKIIPVTWQSRCNVVRGYFQATLENFLYAFINCIRGEINGRFYRPETSSIFVLGRPLRFHGYVGMFQWPLIAVFINKHLQPQGKKRPVSLPHFDVWLQLVC